MVIYHGTIRKTSPKKQIQVRQNPGTNAHLLRQLQAGFRGKVDHPKKHIQDHDSRNNMSHEKKKNSDTFHETLVV